ncbi:MAG: hypothetical protein QXI36_00055 [Candidatus Bathyarchaeia archaeon]
MVVETAEEASKLLNSTTPVRLPTNIPANMRYVRVLVLENVAAYVFYSDEPMAETDNPFILMYMQFGWKFADITGAPPKVVVIIEKLSPEVATMVARQFSSEEDVKSYTDKFNLTVRTVDSIPVFGFDARESPHVEPTNRYSALLNRRPILSD